jgi:hypothetical protein
MSTIKETAEERAQRLLRKQMQFFHERVEIIARTARIHAGHLPTGDADMYVNYIEAGSRHMIAQFKARQPFPEFGTATTIDWGDDD